MQTERPIADARLRAALATLEASYQAYDLAGAALVVTATESACCYPLGTTWNGLIADPMTALGLCIRGTPAMRGRARGDVLLGGTGWLGEALARFGGYTHQWAEQLVLLVRDQGLEIARTALGPVPRLAPWRRADPPG